jgi:hypothetical protein
LLQICEEVGYLENVDNGHNAIENFSIKKLNKAGFFTLSFGMHKICSTPKKSF